MLCSNSTFSVSSELVFWVLFILWLMRKAIFILASKVVWKDSLLIIPHGIISPNSRDELEFISLVKKRIGMSREDQKWFSNCRNSKFFLSQISIRAKSKVFSDLSIYKEDLILSNWDVWKLCFSKKEVIEFAISISDSINNIFFIEDSRFL